MMRLPSSARVVEGENSKAGAWNYLTAEAMNRANGTKQITKR